MLITLALLSIEEGIGSIAPTHAGHTQDDEVYAIMPVFTQSM